MAAKPAPHVAAMDRYAKDVLSGKVLACKWIRLACERHQRDLAASKAKAYPYKFDPVKAERVCRFIELLQHVKGKWALGKSAQHLKLEPWQCFFFCSVFGWVYKATGLRRFRKVRLYVPRKNGKSVVGAGTGLFMFAADGEPGAEVYSGATNEKQAWEVFGPARLMAKGNADLLEHFGITVNAKGLVRLGDSSKFEPVIGKPGDGSSPHCSITDEYHEHATDDQLATMETGMGAREQPLSLVISTAGDNIAGPCYDDWLECQKMLERVHEDDRLFAMIYTIDKDDDWTSDGALRKANPNYGVSVEGDFLLAQQRDSIANQRKQGRFQIKHLNVWIQARNAFINMQRWRESGSPALKLADYAGRRCYMGMDLASKVDLCALVLLFPEDDGSFACFGRYYLPEAKALAPENQHYAAWHQAGILTVSEGNMTDYFEILDDIKDIARQFEIEAFAYDPHNATMLVTACQAEGLPMVEFGAQVLNFSEPMKAIDALILDKKIKHDGDPLMTWAMSNVVAKIDAKDNVYPRKEREENKIDPFVALVMAKGVAMRDDSSTITQGFVSIR